MTAHAWEVHVHRLLTTPPARRLLGLRRLTKRLQQALAQARALEGSVARGEKR